MREAIVLEEIRLLPRQAAHAAAKVPEDSVVGIALRADLQNAADRLCQGIEARRDPRVDIVRDPVPRRAFFKERGVTLEVAADNGYIPVTVPLSKRQSFDLYEDLADFLFRRIRLKDTDPAIRGNNAGKLRMAENTVLEMRQDGIIPEPLRHFIRSGYKKIAFPYKSLSRCQAVDITDSLSGQIEQGVFPACHTASADLVQGRPVVLSVVEGDRHLSPVPDERCDDSVLHGRKPRKAVEDESAPLYPFR